MKKRNTTAAIACAVATLTVAPAIAAADTTIHYSAPIVGNFTRSHYPDRVMLGHDTTSCVMSIEIGRANGKFHPAVIHHYVLDGLSSTLYCPSEGTAFPTRGHKHDELAITPYISDTNKKPGAIYFFDNFKLVSTTTGELFPSYIGTQDFNGDGRADLWETSDEGEGFKTYIQSGKGFVPGPASFLTDDVYLPINFGNLDGKRGTDIATSNFHYSNQPGFPFVSDALVIFGATGQQVILETTNDPVTFTTALVDANHDGKTDVSVTGVSISGPPHVYLNDGAGHFTLAP